MSEDYQKEKAPKTAKIAVIETRGESSLIEWHDKNGTHRGYIENDLIYDGKVLVTTLLAPPLPVGPDPMAIDLRKFTKQLRLRNIWTLADFVQKRNAVVKSLLEAMEV